MILQASGLVKKYGEHTALRGLDLTVDAGEVFCLLGANGAGKTTTIQLFLGFIEPRRAVPKSKGLRCVNTPSKPRNTWLISPKT